MRKQINLLLLCLTAVFFLSSCVSKKKFDQLMSDKGAIDQMLATQQTKVKELEGNLETLQGEKDKLAADFDAERTNLTNELSQVKGDLGQSKEEIAAIQSQLTEKENQYNALKNGIDSAFNPFESNGLGLSAKGGELYLDTPIRYKSGSTKISNEEEQKLQRIANALSKSPNMRLVIEGHTDGVPVKDGASYKSNMELSYARANRVRKALIKLGVNPDQISTVGRGYKMPVVSNDNTEELRASNRRTEFVVAPDITALYNIHKGGK